MHKSISASVLICIHKYAYIGTSDSVLHTEFILSFPLSLYINSLCQKDLVLITHNFFIYLFKPRVIPVVILEFPTHLLANIYLTILLSLD
jgi:hypothetical protein